MGDKSYYYIDHGNIKHNMNMKKSTKLMGWWKSNHQNIYAYGYMICLISIVTIHWCDLSNSLHVSSFFTGSVPPVQDVSTILPPVQEVCTIYSPVEVVKPVETRNETSLSGGFNISLVDVIGLCLAVFVVYSIGSHMAGYSTVLTSNGTQTANPDLVAQGTQSDNPALVSVGTQSTPTYCDPISIKAPNLPFQVSDELTTKWHPMWNKHPVSILNINWGTTDERPDSVTVFSAPPSSPGSTDSISSGLTNHSVENGIPDPHLTILYDKVDVVVRSAPQTYDPLDKVLVNTTSHSEHTVPIDQLVNTTSHSEHTVPIDQLVERCYVSSTGNFSISTRIWRFMTSFNPYKPENAPIEIKNIVYTTNYTKQVTEVCTFIPRRLWMLAHDAYYYQLYIPLPRSFTGNILNIARSLAEIFN